MLNVGHYVVNYVGTSWMKHQFRTSDTLTSQVYTWANNTHDDITTQPFFHVAFPTPMPPRLTLAIGFALERLANTATRRLASQMSQNQVDLIHAHFGRAGVYAIPLKQRTGLPLVTSFYGYDITEYPHKYPVWRDHYRRLFEVGDAFLIEGEYMRQTVIGLGCPPEKAIRIPLGIPLEKIPFTPRQWQPGETLQVIQVADVREKKGIPDSIRAFGLLKQHIPDAHFTIIGDMHGKEAASLLAQIHTEINRYHLHDAVDLLDRLPYDAYLQRMRDAHIFIQPSIIASSGDAEGGAPVSIIEAAASGLLVVASQHCDIPEVILNGETGLLAPEKDYEQLGAHLIWLAEHPNEWDRLTSAGRQHIETNYNLQTQLTAQEAIYHRIASN